MKSSQSTSFLKIFWVLHIASELHQCWEFDCDHRTDITPGVRCCLGLATVSLCHPLYCAPVLYCTMYCGVHDSSTTTFLTQPLATPLTLEHVLSLSIQIIPDLIRNSDASGYHVMSHDQVIFLKCPSIIFPIIHLQYLYVLIWLKCVYNWINTPSHDFKQFHICQVFTNDSLLCLVICAIWIIWGTHLHVVKNFYKEWH